MSFSWGRFDTRTLVLIPIAIAINIVLGQTVASVLKVPVYLDSIGTVLVGVLAGPIPGLVTGVVTNLLWTYVLPAPFHSDYAAPFAVVAAWIGFFSGVVAQYGIFRSRPNTEGRNLFIGAVVIVVVLGVIGYYGFLPFYTDGSFSFFNPEGDTSLFFQIMGYVIGLGFVAAIIGLLALLIVRRDLGVAYVAIAGLVCGIVSAIISAPIAAYVFGGVTGSGHRPARGGLPAGRGGPVHGRPPAGPAVRPDRQDRDLLHRVRPAPGPVAPLHRALPAG